MGVATSSQAISGGVLGAGKISGCVSEESVLSGSLAQKNSICGEVLCDISMRGNLTSAYTTQTAVYEGDYDVIPRVDKQELKTKQKYMTDDVRVHAIPYFEVGNATGGNTVYIAGEIEIE